MLAVVDDEECLTALEMMDARPEFGLTVGRRNGEGRDDRPGNDAAIAWRSEIDEPDAVAIPLEDVPCKFDRHARLPDATQDRRPRSSGASRATARDRAVSACGCETYSAGEPSSAAIRRR